MHFVIENVRLRELVAVVGENQSFFEDFVGFLKGRGFTSLQDFINSDDDAKALGTISTYLSVESEARLFDGLGKPYTNSKLGGSFSLGCFVTLRLNDWDHWFNTFRERLHCSGRPIY